MRACVRACVHAYAVTVMVLHILLCSAADNDAVELRLQDLPVFPIKRQDDLVNTGASLCSRHIHYIPTSVRRCVKMLLRSAFC